MCVIIHKPKGVKLSKEIYDQCFTRNGDGGGMAFVDPDKGVVVVDKGYFKFPEFHKALVALEDQELLVHCRIQTHGKVGVNNCHPFFYQSETHPQFTFAMAHNGILPYRSTVDQSDTSCFAEDVLFPMLDRDPWFLEHKEGRFLVEQFIQDRNKMVILRYDAEEKASETFFLNKKAGTEEEGCWFSNTHWKPYKQAANYFTGWKGHGGCYGGDSEYGHDWPADKPEAGSLWAPSVGAYVNASGYYKDPKTQKYRKFSNPAKDLPLQTEIPEFGSKKGGSTIANDIAAEHNRKAAEEAKGGSIVPFVKPIEVPRDKALEKELKAKNLDHLTKPEREMLGKECTDYLQDLGLDRVMRMNLRAQLTWVRSDCRAAFDEMKDWPDVQIDHHIIKRHVEVFKGLKLFASQQLAIVIK